MLLTSQLRWRDVSHFNSNPPCEVYRAALFVKDIALIFATICCKITVMDATKPFDYPDNFFDFVNSRYVAAFLSPTQGPVFVQELVRVTRPGGFIRLTEVGDDSVTTSPAFEKMMVIFLQACRLSKITFSPTGHSSGLSPMLGYFLRKAGCQNVQNYASIVDWSAGTDAYAPVAQDFQIFFRLLQPFMIGVGATTEEEIEQLHRDIEIELRDEDFCALWTFFTAWGKGQCDEYDNIAILALPKVCI